MSSARRQFDLEGWSAMPGHVEMSLVDYHKLPMKVFNQVVYL